MATSANNYIHFQCQRDGWLSQPEPNRSPIQSRGRQFIDGDVKRQLLMCSSSCLSAAEKQSRRGRPNKVLSPRARTEGANAHSHRQNVHGMWNTCTYEFKHEIGTASKWSGHDIPARGRKFIQLPRRSIPASSSWRVCSGRTAVVSRLLGVDWVMRGGRKV